MKDTQFLTATMRIRALERYLLTRERRERMLDAKTDEEAMRVLTDCGYGDMTGEQVSSETPLEIMLAHEREKTYSEVAAMTPEKSIVDVFRVRYDYHNAKVLIKNEVSGLGSDTRRAEENAPERLLIDAGRISQTQMLEIYRSLAFSRLPRHLGDAIIEARELLSRTGDPQRSDMLLDNACFVEMKLLSSCSPFLRGYVELLIDSSNLRALVRTARIGKGTDFLRYAISPGGSIEPSRILLLLQSGAEPESVFTGRLREAAAMGTSAIRGKGALTAFERQCDNVLTAYLAEARYIAFGEQALIAYIGLRENDFTAIRTIMNGRMAGVPSEAIRERLRETYV